MELGHFGIRASGARLRNSKIERFHSQAECADAPNMSCVDGARLARVLLA
jgi:hypothetical protein